MITHHQKTPAEEPEESDSNDEEIGNPIFGSDGESDEDGSAVLEDNKEENIEEQFQ